MRNNQKTESKRDVYQIITDRILDLLQLVWRPGRSLRRAMGKTPCPSNLVTVKVYLLNAMKGGSPNVYRSSMRKRLGRSLEHNRFKQGDPYLQRDAAFFTSALKF